MPASVLAWGWIRWTLAIALAAFGVLVSSIVAPEILPLTVAHQCHQFGYTGESCPGYVVAWLFLVTVFDFFDSRGAAINAFATIAIAMFTLTLWRSTRQLWQTSNRSANAAFTANALLRDEQRPWVSIQNVRIVSVRALPFADDRWSVWVDYSYDISNSGKTPALCTNNYQRVTVEPIWPGTKFDTLFGAVNEATESNRGWALAPGARARIEDTGAFEYNIPPEGDGGLSIQITAVVAYKNARRKLATTAQGFQILQRQGYGLAQPTGINLGSIFAGEPAEFHIRRSGVSQMT